MPLVGAAGGLLTVAGLMLAACAGGVPAKRPYTQLSPDRPRLTPGSTAPPTSQAAPIDAGAESLDVRALLDGIENAPWRTPPTATGTVDGASAPPARPRPTAIETASGAQAATEPPVAEATPPAPAPAEALPAGALPAAPSQPPDTEDQIARLVAEAGDAAGSEPLRAAIRLAALESLRPGSATAELAAAKKRLTPDETLAFETVSGLLRDVAAAQGAPADAEAVATAIQRHARRLESTRLLAIARAALCTRVEGFGRYTALGSNTFVRGRPHAAILYVAVENFSQRSETPLAAGSGEPRASHGLKDTLVRLLDAASGEPSRQDNDPAADWITELSQTVSLFHDSDNLEVWRAPEESVRDVARHRRRDYFLVRRLDLPANLSVGRYNLKVTLRDAGAGGAVAEAIIPIEIVADPALARSR
jgi:hypothetical protein